MLSINSPDELIAKRIADEWTAIERTEVIADIAALYKLAAWLKGNRYPYWTRSASGSSFIISPHSFYQVNPVQTEAMYGAALEFAALSGNETVWDLYCGIGTISLFLARQAKKVYGVEMVPAAIRDAKENAKRNGIANAEFFTGAAEEVLPAWQKANPDTRIDVITVDPPRKGCDETALRTMAELSPERIVYVSCNPATLARDIKYLRADGYELTRVRPVDNFPRTMHVETVALLSRSEK